MEQDFLPAPDEFKPRLTLISASFDAHAEDLLGRLNLVEDGYCWITTLINDVANRHSHSRIVSMLKRGYHLESLSCSVRAHIEMMLND